MARTAAFFDLDKTIIAKSSVLAFGKPFYREGLLSRRAIVRSVYAQVVFMLVGADEEKMEKVREAMLAMTKGWNQQHVAAIVRETLDEIVTPIIYAEALELIDEHHAAGRQGGDRLVVARGGRPAARRVPRCRRRDRDACRGRRRTATTPASSSSTRTDRTRPTRCARWRSREGIDLAGSYAYSDSITDLPMLRAVGHPVAVNPDRDLARVARAEGWGIENFEHPVRLRDRMPVPALGPSIAVGGVLAAAGGVATWWWLRHRARDP